LGIFHITFSSLAFHLTLTFVDSQIDGGSGRWQTYLETLDVVLFGFLEQLQTGKGNLEQKNDN
jgi:hypothetical protein